MDSPHFFGPVLFSDIEKLEQLHSDVTSLESGYGMPACKDVRFQQEIFTARTGVYMGLRAPGDLRHLSREIGLQSTTLKRPKVTALATACERFDVPIFRLIRFK